MKALVTAPVCPLFARPEAGSERVDEVLLGMTVEVLGTPLSPLVPVETAYGYHGYAPADVLLADDHRAAQWERAPKAVVARAVCDGLSAPNIRSGVLLSPVRGCVVSPAGVPDENGWQEVLLPDGGRCCLRRGFLGPFRASPPPCGEEALRSSLVRAALSYLGAPYRWGGKTPLGIDCSGLVSMAYHLNGITIWRDAQIKEGYPVHPIPLSCLGRADLLFFPGHVAMYLGEGRYIHATARDGSDGVVVNSLDPHSPDYRADLAENITASGSIF